ncbi:ATP-dependent DNA helicase [Paraburkholderia caballeronis]|uniref:DNA excision repair protein ERCC-2 n=1 Tax=Paraburkholderia caballeronis TaxID=416943 RepID=A0A1H7MRF8_9BURK|nr:ATP-dependent DNA helicase [Paraburkholderia caballeronis]PXW26473.1 DNA excision repair protein ERCC-2 [Paraburkholderia caballeronis]PXX02020.1 DNA excision repair protein ERCC-2 [Paraburkholderia caballeronis]RAK01177.1 DNA excision repair protein ERCC-2 [Paraburkholderia caballeronis]SEB93415.1 DNA excision repair protein ERCC-2 [Paraburkholderia caballeronis]SEL13418.1 DNA excision repair protein ERCC-2 [Paraburkholderia caballeronis]
MTYTVAVRTLCEFTAKRGDLDLRFTPSPDANEGRAGHLAIASRRPNGYETEIALSGTFGALTVRGRADGYDPAAHRLEEFKTYRGDLDSMRENQRALHWAQLRVYGWLMCERQRVDSIELALVYYDVGSGRETALVEHASAAELKRAFDDQCRRFVAWAEQESAHRATRDAALAQLRLPHPSFRRGQRELAEAVWRAASQGRCLLAQAPTGIGKTIGTLFPMLKAAPRAALDKVFFLSAKSSGRQLALDALDTLAAAQPDGATLPLRVLELVARDKSCEHPDLACHGESCPLARGFYDRLPAARAAALEHRRLDRSTLADVAREHRVCPYYLGQELARWSDVIVGDYNYYFDTSAILFMLAAHNQWCTALLVDEAHNLPERARAMYSAELAQTQIDAVRHSANAPVKRALTRLQRHWNTLNAVQPGVYRATDMLPSDLLAALGELIAALGDQFAEPAEPALLRDPELERFYFDALHFVRIAERFDTQSLFDVTPIAAPTTRGRRGPRTTLCIRNVVPAGALRARIAAAHSVTLFSATLAPSHYYADMLGLPADTVHLDIDAPFAADQLEVHVARRISTRYRDRERSLDALVERIATQYDARPGNYLCFFSSYDYLERAANAFVARHPQVVTWRQSRTMDEAAQHAFVARFVEDGCGIGFAVLGGAFGEGIDLPGTRLIGTFIATLGMPQVNPVNEQLRARMDTLYGAGFDYTYLIPGLRKVVQAAGRVIRTERDRGVVHLLDDRFARAEVRALLPGWWRIEGGRGGDV